MLWTAFPLPPAGSRESRLPTVELYDTVSPEVMKGLDQFEIGAFGVAPQKTWVPITPTMWISTMLSIIDFAVFFPTPTEPPEAVNP
jgi:hypothetical protein